MAQPIVTPETDPRWVMTPELRQALTGLHDLQLAEPGKADYWPIILVVSGALAVIALAWRYWRDRPRQQLLRQLRQIRPVGTNSLTAIEARIAVQKLAGLLRRAATSHTHPPMPAGLTGVAWLQWLDARAPQADRGTLLGDAGQCLLTLPYVSTSNKSPRSPDSSELNRLSGVVERWLRSNC